MKLRGYDYEALCSDVMVMHKEFPFLKLGEFGKSLCGRSLYQLEIGRGETVFLCGCFHGMEHITAALLVRLCRELCLRLLRDESIGVQKAEILFLKRRVILAPCVNPDGVEISLHGAERAGEYAHIVSRSGKNGAVNWQANARGVDLNHNFDAGWQKLREIEKKMGFNEPGPTRFGGYFPESEPETAAITALCRKEKIKRVMACHSQGEEIYYSYGEKTPPQSHTLAKKMAMLSGYQVSLPEGEIASYGGFKDWFIEEYGRAGFTVEFGKGKNPLPLSELEDIWRKTRNLFFEFITAGE